MYKEKKITEENRWQPQTNRQDVTSQNVKVKEKKITEENKATVNHKPTEDN